MSKIFNKIIYKKFLEDPSGHHLRWGGDPQGSVWHKKEKNFMSKIFDKIIYKIFLKLLGHLSGHHLWCGGDQWVSD